MEEESVKSDGYSPDLVPVRKVIPEMHPHAGAALIMKDSSFRMILEVGSVNFEMQSITEQIGTIRGFGAMLDSLDPGSPLQIYCRTKRLDTEAYMRQFDNRLEDPNLSPLLRNLIEKRIETFQDFVESKNLLQRSFYITIGYKGIQEPVGERLGDSIPGVSIFKALLGTTVEKKGIIKEPDDIEIDVAIQQLHLRAQNVERYLNSIGINQVKRLGEHGVIRLLSEIYNPGLAEKQRPVFGANVGAFMPSLPEHAKQLRPAQSGRRAYAAKPLGTLPPGNPTASTGQPRPVQRPPMGNPTRPVQRPQQPPLQPSSDNAPGRRRRKQQAPPPANEPQFNIDDDDFSGPPPLI